MIAEFANLLKFDRDKFFWHIVGRDDYRLNSNFRNVVCLDYYDGQIRAYANLSEPQNREWYPGDPDFLAGVQEFFDEAERCYFAIYPKASVIKEDSNASVQYP